MLTRVDSASLETRFDHRFLMSRSVGVVTLALRMHVRMGMTLMPSTVQY